MHASHDQRSEPGGCGCLTIPHSHSVRKGTSGRALGYFPAELERMLGMAYSENAQEILIFKNSPGVMFRDPDRELRGCGNGSLWYHQLLPFPHPLFKLKRETLIMKVPNAAGAGVCEARPCPVQPPSRLPPPLPLALICSSVQLTCCWE